MRKIVVPQAAIASLFGAHDANLKIIESLLRVEIRTQGDELIVTGQKADEQRAERLFEQLLAVLDAGYALRNGDVKTAAQLVPTAPTSICGLLPQGRTRGAARRVNPKSVNQRRYLDTIDRYDIVFGVGPAGTGRRIWRWRRPSATCTPRR
jgi:phosphate starvation-inducible PhoH-like protein